MNEIRDKRKKNKNKPTKKNKWAKFTYVGRETRCITKLFRNTNVKIAYTTNNNLGKLLSTQTAQKRNKYYYSGVYQLTCPTCNKKYMGQTGRPFLIRFREHYNDYKYANNRSKSAQHLIDEGHSFGPMNDIIGIMHIAKKGRMLDTLEIFYIDSETKRGN
jgi:hypothetical protein